VSFLNGKHIPNSGNRFSDKIMLRSGGAAAAHRRLYGKGPPLGGRAAQGVFGLGNLVPQKKIEPGAGL
jgi:hypothetical protein